MLENLNADNRVECVVRKAGMTAVPDNKLTFRVLQFPNFLTVALQDNPPIIGNLLGADRQIKIPSADVQDLTLAVFLQNVEQGLRSKVTNVIQESDRRSFRGSQRLQVQ